MSLEQYRLTSATSPAWLAFLRYAAGMWLLMGSVWLVGCEPQEKTLDYRRSLHLPSGWTLEPHSQMLARSYPTDAWITIISRLKGESQRLFVSPYRTPPLPQNSLFSWGARRPMAPMPGESSEPSKKPVIYTYGFSYVFRSNRSVHLELRLPMKGRDQEERVYRKAFFLPKTGASWKTMRFLYRDFKPLDPKETRRLSPYFVKGVEFWEQPAKTNPFSVSLTMEGPFLYQSKKRLAPTSRPVVRATSRPVVRATSRPVVRATSRPILPNKPR